jgi:hypothetical protein
MQSAFVTNNFNIGGTIMASKRKRKKEMKKQHVANATAIGNPKTSMAEAMESANKALEAAEKASAEAKAKKAAAEKAETDATEAKAKADKAASNAVAKEKAAQAQAKQEEIRKTDKKKKEKPKKKYIIGFGTKTQLTDDPDNEGRAIFHAVSNIDNSALCDSRIINIPIDKEISAKDCNCKACQKYVAFRNLLELESKTDQKVEAKPDKKEKPKPKSKPKKKKAKADDSDDLAPIRQMLTTRVRNMEKRLWDRMKEYIDKAFDAKPSFYIIQTVGQRYSIVHEKSRLAIVSGMTQKDAEKLLPKFLKIPYKWDGTSSMPQEWMRAIKKITEKFTSGLKKPKRKIKRRKLKEKKTPKPKLARKIKRRKVKDKPVRKIKRRSRTR